MAEQRLEGRVAQILNERELAITLGAKDGVKVGMIFAVLAATPLEIRDPVSKELLDTIDREKVRVKAAEVRDKVTICVTYQTRTVGGFGIRPFNFDLLLSPPHEEPVTLRAKDSALPPPLSPEDSYVRIGDRVMQVEDAAVRR